jgi:hypothetical protein
MHSNAQSFGANPFRLIGLASLNSTPLVSTFRGYFFAHSMQLVTPGSAANRAAAIGEPHRLHRLVGCLFVTDIVSNRMQPACPEQVQIQCPMRITKPGPL